MRTAVQVLRDARRNAQRVLKARQDDLRCAEASLSNAEQALAEAEAELREIEKGLRALEPGIELAEQEPEREQTLNWMAARGHCFDQFSAVPVERDIGSRVAPAVSNPEAKVTLRGFVAPGADADPDGFILRGAGVSVHIEPNTAEAKFIDRRDINVALADGPRGCPEGPRGAEGVDGIDGGCQAPGVL